MGWRGWESVRVGLFLCCLILSSEAIDVSQRVSHHGSQDRLLNSRARFRSISVAQEATRVERPSSLLSESLSTGTMVSASHKSGMAFTVTVLSLSATVAFGELAVSYMRKRRTAQALHDVEELTQEIMIDQSQQCVMARQIAFGGKALSSAVHLDVEGRMEVLSQSSRNETLLSKFRTMADEVKAASDSLANVYHRLIDLSCRALPGQGDLSSSLLDVRERERQARRDFVFSVLKVLVSTAILSAHLHVASLGGDPDSGSFLNGDEYEQHIELEKTLELNDQVKTTNNAALAAELKKQKDRLNKMGVAESELKVAAEVKAAIDEASNAVDLTEQSEGIVNIGEAVTNFVTKGGSVEDFASSSAAYMVHTMDSGSFEHASQAKFFERAMGEKALLMPSLVALWMPNDLIGGVEEEAAEDVGPNANGGGRGDANGGGRGDANGGGRGDDSDANGGGRGDDSDANGGGRGDDSDDVEADRFSQFKLLKLKTKAKKMMSMFARYISTAKGLKTVSTATLTAATVVAEMVAPIATTWLGPITGVFQLMWDTYELYESIKDARVEQQELLRKVNTATSIHHQLTLTTEKTRCGVMASILKAKLQEQRLLRAFQEQATVASQGDLSNVDSQIENILKAMEKDNSSDSDDDSTSIQLQETLDSLKKQRTLDASQFVTSIFKRVIKPLCQEDTAMCLHVIENSPLRDFLTEGLQNSAPGILAHYKEHAINGPITDFVVSYSLEQSFVLAKLGYVPSTPLPKSASLIQDSKDDESLRHRSLWVCRACGGSAIKEFEIVDTATAVGSDSPNIVQVDFDLWIKFELQDSYRSQFKHVLKDIAIVELPAGDPTSILSRYAPIWEEHGWVVKPLAVEGEGDDSGDDEPAKKSGFVTTMVDKVSNRLKRLKLSAFGGKFHVLLVKLNQWTPNLGWFVSKLHPPPPPKIHHTYNYQQIAIWTLSGAHCHVWLPEIRHVVPLDLSSSHTQWLVTGDLEIDDDSDCAIEGKLDVLSLPHEDTEQLRPLTNYNNDLIAFLSEPVGDDPYWVDMMCFHSRKCLVTMRDQGSGSSDVPQLQINDDMSLRGVLDAFDQLTQNEHHLYQSARHALSQYICDNCVFSNATSHDADMNVPTPLFEPKYRAHYTVYRPIAVDQRKSDCETFHSKLLRQIVEKAGGRISHVGYSRVENVIVRKLTTVLGALLKGTSSLESTLREIEAHNHCTLRLTIPALGDQVCSDEGSQWIVSLTEGKKIIERCVENATPVARKVVFELLFGRSSGSIDGSYQTFSGPPSDEEIETAWRHDFIVGSQFRHEWDRKSKSGFLPNPNHRDYQFMVRLWLRPDHSIPQPAGLIVDDTCSALSLSSVE